MHTLRRWTGQRVYPLDVSDDRSAGVLKFLSDEAHWGAFEGALSRQLLRVYDRQPERVRLDSATANGHWPASEDIIDKARNLL